MAKLLLVIAVLVVVYLFFRSLGGKKPAAPPPEAAKHGEDMVRCQVCGVHLPKSEAITSRGEFFCTREHLQLAGQDRAGR